MKSRMMGNRPGYVQAIELGIALGLVVAIGTMVMPTGLDDFSKVLWPAGRVRDPYASGLYFYPVWNTWTLRALALFPRQFGLCFILASSVVYLVALAPVWGTPPWMALLAPPFIAAMFWGHPFEAAVFVGVTMLWQGWREDRSEVMGVGLALCLFKVQIGLLPALAGVYYTLGLSRRRWVAWSIPVIMVLATTVLDWHFNGDLWVGPWWQAIQQASSTTTEWNASFVQGFHFFSWLWLPICLWLLSKVQNFQRQLWVAMAVNLLVSPYWAGYSLWPLVAMAGCWTRSWVLREG